MRGLAVLMVVIYHSGLPLFGGYVGVDVFFVISGFVITLGIRRKLGEGRFSFKDFYVSRIRRILPALTATLVICLALLPLLAPIASIRTSGRTGMAAALFNANHYLILGAGYFSPNANFNVFLHTWSLSLEEQFYMAFPLVMFLLWRGTTNTQRHRRLVVGLIVVCVASFLISLRWSYGGPVLSFNGERVAFFSVVSRAWQFGVGALIALSASFISRTMLTHKLAAWVGLAMVLTAGVIFNESTVFPGVAVIVPTVGAALMITAGQKRADNGVVGAWLCSGPMVRMGDLSYSWYLWHWPLMVFAVTTFPSAPLAAGIIAGALSYGAAVLSERYVESPIRYRPKDKRAPALLMLAVSMTLPLVAWFASHTIQNQWLKSASGGEPSIAQRAVLSEQEYTALSCDGTETPANPAPECTWGDSNAEKHVVLVGDSNARHWIPAFQRLGTEMDVRFIATTLSACPFVDLKVANHGVLDERCNQWFERSIEDIESVRPDVVIVGSAIDIHVLRDDRHFIAEDGTMYQTASSKLNAYESAMRRLNKQLSEMGVTLVVLEPVPKFMRASDAGVGWYSAFKKQGESALINRCSTASLRLNPAWCALERKLSDPQWTDYSLVRQMLETLEDDGIRTMKVGERICPEGRCTDFDVESKEIIYSDTKHIAPDGALRLTSAFREMLLQTFDNSKN